MGVGCNVSSVLTLGLVHHRPPARPRKTRGNVAACARVCLKCACDWIIRDTAKLTPTTHPSPRNTDHGTGYQRSHYPERPTLKPDGTRLTSHERSLYLGTSWKTRSSKAASATPELSARNVGSPRPTRARVASAPLLLPRGLPPVTRFSPPGAHSQPVRACVSPSRRRTAHARGPARPARLAICLSLLDTVTPPLRCGRSTSRVLVLSASDNAIICCIDAKIGSPARSQCNRLGHYPTRRRAVRDATHKACHGSREPWHALCRSRVTDRPPARLGILPRPRRLAASMPREDRRLRQQNRYWSPISPPSKSVTTAAEQTHWLTIARLLASL